MTNGNGEPAHDPRTMRESRLEILAAFSLVQSDPHRFLTLIEGCENDADAVAAVRREYGVGVAASIAMVQMSFGRLTAEARRRVAEETGALRLDDEGDVR